MIPTSFRASTLVAAIFLAMSGVAQSAQDQLVPNTTIDGPVLRFDWPAISVGVASYEEGPTGVTGPDATIKVTIAGDRLLINASSQAGYDDIPTRLSVILRPISEREFYIDGRYRTRVSFVVDAAGKATKIVLDQGRWQQTGDRVPDPGR
jgi:hypothetical protein